MLMSNRRCFWVLIWELGIAGLGLGRINTGLACLGDITIPWEERITCELQSSEHMRGILHAMYHGHLSSSMLTLGAVSELPMALKSSDGNCKQTPIMYNTVPVRAVERLKTIPVSVPLWFCL
jgi:hypothetical protein